MTNLRTMTPEQNKQAGTSAWHQFALCRGTMSEGRNYWFAYKNPKRQSVAKAVCAECPVQLPCRDSGRHEPIGVWGGETVSIHPSRRQRPA